ncbi:hypothetical protein [Caenibacillus caldisaponilyticus]|uniref:hypothetical protein n=1 Tax=Caenibacillus caldisaponilyticus TaxID=1674942 RepID=UPI000988391D|nr:hypothetical protein [Caenibacillus caldisaponilyticus]
MNNNIDTNLIISSLRAQIAQLSYEKALLDALATQQQQKIGELEKQLNELKTENTNNQRKGKINDANSN